MAHIDTLIASVKDERLREALRAEYDKVTKNRRLGLVFDRHMPESVTLPGFAIREGEKVQVMKDDLRDPAELDGTGVWTVRRLDAAGPGPRAAVLVDGEGQVREVEADRLVATREFGDPIYPGLVSTGRVERGGDKPFHTVINAENYHALEALLFAHEGEVDAIYIDPPYNTGARDWKYNNDYVDDGDPYRHSKWLSFIERRLLLAKRLLNPADSVLIVTIDEKEYLRLGLLLEQVFPSARIQMISSVINPKGSARGRQFRRTDEYIFVVMMGESGPARLLLGAEWSSSAAGQPEEEGAQGEDPSPQTPEWTSMMRRGSNSARADRMSMFYPIYVDPEGPRIVDVGEALPAGQHVAPARSGLVAVLPIRRNREEGRWQVSPAELRSRIAQGRVRLGRKTDYGYVVNYLPDGAYAAVMSDQFVITGRAEDGSLIAVGTRDSRRIAPTQWKITSHNASEQGTGLLQMFLPGRKFPFPKSLYAVEDALRFFVAEKPDALVVDFFAGSGTTAHAVMRLNRQDGGRRRSISVTNNEVGDAEAETLREQGLRPGDPSWEALGICDYITKPRIAAAITGETPTGEPIKGNYRFVDEFPMADGFEENAEFFTLSYEDPSLVSLGRKFAAIAPLLWLKAGAQGERIDEVDPAGWALPDGACYGVLFEVSRWSELVEAVSQRDDITHVFVVTDSLVEYQQIAARLDPAIATTRLYADYLRSFQINAGAR